MRAFLLAPAALLLLTPVAAAEAGNPLEDHDHDGDMELGPVCVWGFSDGCALRAYACFQPYAPGFGINCI